MDVGHIIDALERLFNDEDEPARIVFWNDPDGEFVELLPDIALEGVEVINLDGAGSTRNKGAYRA